MIGLMPIEAFMDISVLQMFGAVGRLILYRPEIVWLQFLPEGKPRRDAKGVTAVCPRAKTGAKQFQACKLFADTINCLFYITKTYGNAQKQLKHVHKSCFCHRRRPF
jgi:hypothetical protein